ncbi:hypothetical protein M8C13_05090 [Crossiella sp. SN42]|uniref:hypothetical protein n=1 Tax=Crossiella sp. SN42 TaxID=2944808 RepID=UPI00207C1520|nr:hypothetical protein [Crossiella sp. SN42]MCO1575133.1 hypothetical protein [Crossiella sp. SN42]
MVSRLPITIGPAHNEIALSYLARLAALHELPPTGLWSQVSRQIGRRVPRLDAELLATVANQPLARLARAVVEVLDPEPEWLALRHEPQRDCWRCDARHPGGPVLHLLGHHRYVCTRHRVWIGPPDHPDHLQPSLDLLPEVVAAQRQHLRLLRRRGLAATFDAVLTGFLICAHRWDTLGRPARQRIATTDVWHGWERRVELLIPPGNITGAFSASRLFAVLYPEAVSLAEVLSSLRWRRLAAGDPRDQRRFAAEIGRRLGQPDYQPRRTEDPIAHWMQADCWHPPSAPISNYRKAKTFGGSTFRTPDKRTEEIRATNAASFAKNRRGGTVVLHHRTLSPVVYRAWTPPMEVFADALAHTTEVTYCQTEPGHFSDFGSLSRLEFVRPEPVDSEFLTSAVEPLDW